VAAHQVLTEGGVNNKNRAIVVDKLAAVFILQGYLDKLYLEKNGEI
jgi:putative Holliday junction resolvase